MKKEKLAVLVDGTGLVYRSYFAMQQKQLSSSDGRPIGAIFGFCSTLISLIKTHRADFFCMVFDSGGKTFRSKIFPDYKSNRKATPEDLKQQFPLLDDLCSAFGVPTMKKQGIEADDIIATYTSQLSEQDYEVCIISSDKDLMQLVNDNDNVHMFDLTKAKLIHEKDVVEKYGVRPSQMVCFQALVGDSSDNIPGVQGIGPITAAKLLNNYISLEGIYRHINDVEPQKIRDKLINQKESAKMSFNLAKLHRNIEIGNNFKDFHVNYNRNRAADFLRSYHFNSLMNKLSL